MEFAKRALVLALALLMLCAAVSAQTLRNENDPRNTAPTVGTGGPPGGATGLFTVYDGQTLRRGEFTFSVAYSNYDRDPGNVDITETPLSFQVGLGDYAELFFNTDGFRGIKVNNRRNLSASYLPNSFGRTLPAIVLAPLGLGSATRSGVAVFRPANAQGFVQFPFIGVGPGPILARPSDTRFVETFGGIAVGGDGFFRRNFGGADAFPGIGSAFGSILPGIVLQTETFTAFGATGTRPVTSTVAPVYLPDAPFINREYGESSFSTFTVGAKFRVTDVNNPLGVALIPFYRFYFDKADDFDGFNQLQRGASPGGNLGDFGGVLAVDGRLSRSVNISANVGYIFNSNPRADFASTTVGGFTAGGGDLTLLDRPDELMTAVGFDFPINRFFQPIAELRTVHYVGGRTPNAFENDPIDGLVGIRVFPRRYMGFSAAYRRHLNEQSQDRFSSTLPRGFIGSDDPNGFIGQFWIGRRNARAPEFLPNQAPTVTLTAAQTEVTVCPRDASLANPANGQVQLTANATDPDGDTLLYTYTTTGGRIVGEGPNVTLDLTGVSPGTYTTTVEVNDGCGCIAFSTATVNVVECPAPPPCPTVTVTCADTVEVGQPITYTANVSGGDPAVTPTFNWTVSAGTITSGQGTNTITVDTAGTGGQSITATATVSGYPAECQGSATCTTQVTETRVARKVDQYGNIAFNDEKARLDNFAIQLQNEPGSSGLIIAYGGRRGRAGEAQARADRARDYLVNTRGVDPSRITTVDGGFREELEVELWIVPTGAPQPTASPTVDASEVQTTTAPRRRAPRRRGRR